MDGISSAKKSEISDKNPKLPGNTEYGEKPKEELRLPTLKYDFITC